MIVVAQPLRHLRDDARIAIVNRADAAVRLIHGVRDHNLERGTQLRTIALYTDGDADSWFVGLADEAVGLGPARVLDEASGQQRHSYLDLDRMAAALTEARADAVWVGWGFVSERADFAELCARMGITFIGPRPEVTRRLGDKIGAKQLAESLGIAVAAWSGGPVDGLPEASVAGRRIGYPLLAKAAAGGGGRGIRVVEDEAALAGALSAVAAEAGSAFGDSTIFLEKRLGRARHIEVQIAADEQGGVWAIGVRDCTVQRRRQKMIEESGAAGLESRLLELKENARAIARAAGYTGVGTVEFLYDIESGAICFMEVNPRLQVEHGVTELTSGVDLVRLQLDLAAGRPLPGPEPVESGYAVEARLTAEDVQEDFRPAPGRLVLTRLPSGPGLRVDAGVREGDEILPDFDPLVLKIMAYGADRREGLARLRRALQDTQVVVAGGATTNGFLLRLLDEPALLAADVHTDWVDELVAAGPEGADDADVAVVLAAVGLAERVRARDVAHLMSSAARGRPHLLGTEGQVVDLSRAGTAYQFGVFRQANDRFLVRTPDGDVEIERRRTGPNEVIVRVAGIQHPAAILAVGASTQVDIAGNTYRIAQAEESGVLRAPSPSVVVQVRVMPGERVAAGDVLLILESMKLELPVRAPVAGVVGDILVSVGSRVDVSEALVRVDSAGEVAAPEAGERVGFGRLVTAPADADALNVLLVLRRCLQGFDAGPVPAAKLDKLLAAAYEQFGDSSELIAPERAVLDLYARCADLAAPRRDETAETPTRGLSSRELLYAFLRAPGRSQQSLPADFLKRLGATLDEFGANGLDADTSLDEACYRLCRAQQLLPVLEPAMVRILRRWVVAATSVRAELGGDGVEVLATIAARTEDLSSTVAEAARSAAYQLYIRASESAAPSAQRPPRPVAAIDPEQAERLELWRWADFELTLLAATEQVYLFQAVARDNPEDSRLVSLVDVLDVGAVIGPDGEIESLPEVERLLLESLGMMRDHLATTSLSGYNRIVLYVRPVWAANDTALRRITRRLAPATRHLGLERVQVRVRTPSRGRAATDRLIHISSPATTGMSLGESVPSDRLIRPLTQQQSRQLKLRRRGLRDPYEIVYLLISPSATISDFPPGEFQEYDVDAQGALVPVDRPPGSNPAGIVVGLIQNRTADHPAGLRRVLLLGDPHRGLGALAEPECRRILGALDLARELQVPVEWFTLSSGARISMDSGTENMDWVARVLKSIIGFTQAGGEINIVVTGVNVGAQPYFNAEATMLMHTRGILVMIASGSMLLTGKEALDFAGGVSAADNLGIGGYDRVMGPNGQAQYWAPSLEQACAILFRHYAHTYVEPGESITRRRPTVDAATRDISSDPHPPVEGADFTQIGDIFSSAHNPDRKKPFDIRAVMAAVTDRDCDPLERWAGMAGAESAVVWDAHVGGYPSCVVGIESRPVPRSGIVPADGPETWTGATLFPRSSKKVARAINSASSNRPLVVLANLAGFDGSPESLRELQLEYGAEIGRAVTNFVGPIVFIVLSRYHGGAFVVFSKALNERLEVLAVAGAKASVIGGSAAAAVVFSREVAQRVSQDPRLKARSASDVSRPGAEDREAALRHVRADVRARVAREFDEIHTVERALAVGSIDRIVEASELRAAIIESIGRSIGKERR